MKEHGNLGDNQAKDTPEMSIDHILAVEPEDSDFRQLGSTPKTTQSSYRQDRVDIGIQNDMDYHTSGGLNRGHSERRYRRSLSPANYYSETVSSNPLQ